MSREIAGTIKRVEMGTGTWSLAADSGETYELKDAPSQLQSSGLKVKVKGKIRDDVMTMAMIGPVLEVQSFEVLD